MRDEKMEKHLEEKMYEWTPDKIRWYQDACEYPWNNRNQLLADAIMKHLSKEVTICDLGCGIGGLSLVLSPKVHQVIAVDQNHHALECLRESIYKKQIHNIEVMEGNYKNLELSPLPDVTILCMTGGLVPHLKEVLSLTGKELYFITGNSGYHHFKTHKKKKSFETTEQIKASLEANGLKYEEEILLTRFGQPFKSMEDAVLFMSCYNREESIEQIKTHLLEKLEETKDETFPYYYPCEKAYRLFRIFTKKVKGF